MKCNVPARRNKRDSAVIALACFHRYGWPVPMLAATFILKRTGGPAAAALGIGLLAYAAWTFLGYCLKWRHVYCSYQNAYHQKMTPHRIRWHEIKKSDAYGIPLIFAGLGIALLLAVAFGL